MKDQLTQNERAILLKIARQSLELGVMNHPLHPLKLGNYPEKLRQPGASFVTLTKKGQLRGCIGTLEHTQPLIDDVREHAVAAAMQDYRFPNVNPGELAEISIEISRLTAPKVLEYENGEDLLNQLQPGIDGVVIKDGFQRATFLPQVWEKIPNPADFLNQLCRKMGSMPDTWRHKKFEVLTYQVEEFHE